MPVHDRFRLIPPQASEYAASHDALWWFMVITSTLVTAILCVLVGYFAIRYRRQSEDEVPPFEKAPHSLEWIFSAVLFAIFMVCFFWGTRLYVQIKRPVENALEISVMGKQWMWKMQHPGGQMEINELHVPVGRPVKLTMISHDVIHSFGLPAFRIKQDVLPGSYSTQWFTPTQKGEYHLFCQEYCGFDHSGMIGRVVVMDPNEYESWLSGVPIDETEVTAGSKLFVSYGCAQCHGQTAPTLAGLFGRQVRLEDGSTVTADEAYLRESILTPTAKVVAGYGRLMPSFRGQLTEEQVSSLVSYIKTLGAARADSLSTTGVAAPVTQPAVIPQAVPNVPPAAEPPGVGQPAPGGDARP